jgi:hypothetical protein
MTAALRTSTRSEQPILEAPFRSGRAASLVQTGEQRRSVSGKDRLHNELVRVDQSQVRQRQGECHASDPEAVTWLLFEPLNRLCQVAL